MNWIIPWLEDQMARRPLWMNVAMGVCAYMTVVFMPWDFFVKPLIRPISAAEEVWFGIIFRGWGAKLTEPLHWAIYATGWYGFWRMKPWMWPWAAVYCAQLTLAMVVWPILYIGGLAGWASAAVCGVFFGALTYALWNAVDRFGAPGPTLRERYGDWAVVTGASAGIGAEFARALARGGMSVVLIARRKDRLQELAEELERNYGVETQVLAADLATVRGVDQVARAIGALEVGLLVNNAGFGCAGRFANQDTARLRQMVQLNCTAPVVLTHKVVPGMIERGRGGIIVVGSVAGRQPIPLHAVYAATKGFDLLFGEALWAELRDQGVDVTVLQPGPVATEFEQVAGEAREDPSADERPEDTVRTALEALGHTPSVVSGWFNYLRSNASRFLPRSILAFVAAEFMSRQTPPETR